ncbi:MAG: hypothetical protein N2C12_09335, partial [Planctomycetales bacterium]
QPIQQAFQMVEMQMSQPGNEIAQVKQMLEVPEFRQAFDLVVEMVSSEVFVYGNRQTSGTMALMMEAMGTMRYSPMLYAVVQAEIDLNQNEFAQKMILDMLADNLDNVAIPGIVFGFKIKNAEVATEQLTRLEGMIRGLMQSQPDLQGFKDNVKREKIGEGDYLTITVPGSMVPWDEIPFSELQEEEGQYNALQKKLRKLNCVVSLGVRDDYVILAIGDSTDDLAKIGKAPLLADHEKLAPLKAAGTHRYTGIGYASSELVNAVSTQPEDLDDIIDIAKQLLPHADVLDDDTQNQILNDIEELVTDLRPLIPRPGAQMSFSYLTDRGIESQGFDWSENLRLDGTKPLTILNHLGGNPILAVVVRNQYRPGDYDLLVKWLGKAHDYFQQLAIPTMSASDLKNFRQFSDVAIPLLQELNDINQNMLIPAMADGQFGFVITAREKTTQWHKMLPQTKEPLGVPAPALVFGVSDADLFEKALSKFRGVINSVLQIVHKTIPSVPEIELPPARVWDKDIGAKVYYYRPPEEWGVYRRLSPNVGIADNLAVMSLFPAQTRKLVQENQLQVDGGPLADTDRPLAAAVYFSWTELVDLLEPWANEIARMQDQQMQAAQQRYGGEVEVNEDGESPMLVMILATIKQGASFLKVFKGYTSVTYTKDGVLITHSETRFEDLK